MAFKRKKTNKTIPVHTSVVVKGYKRRGGDVKQSVDYRTAAHTRKGKPVKQSKVQFNKAYTRNGATVKKHTRRIYHKDLI